MFISSESSVKKMVELYVNDGLSTNKISKIIGCDSCTVASHLRKQGVTILPRTNNKYNLNSDYFTKLDCEDKAYWLGFLMADGYNSGKFIRVDIKDDGHLDKLRDLVYPDKDMPVRTKNNGTVYYLTINNAQILYDLNRHGIVQRKSMVAAYPSIDSTLNRAFIRGVFDGDGCLTYSMDGNYRRYKFSIVGNKDLLNIIHQTLSDCTGVYLAMRKHKTITEISVKGNQQIMKVLNWLYTDSTMHLDRKFEKYQDMLQHYESKKK